MLEYSMLDQTKPMSLGGTCLALLLFLVTLVAIVVCGITASAEVGLPSFLVAGGASLINAFVLAICRRRIALPVVIAGWSLVGLVATACLGCLVIYLAIVTRFLTP
jgi:thioesterase domain-containing protein